MSRGPGPRDVAGGGTDRLKGDRDALRAIFASEPDRDADPFAQLPVNLERLVWAAQKQFECGERLDTAVLDPRVVLEGVTRLCAIRPVGETSARATNSRPKLPQRRPRRPTTRRSSSLF